MRTTVVITSQAYDALRSSSTNFVDEGIKLADGSYQIEVSEATKARLELAAFIFDITVSDIILYGNSLLRGRKLS